MRCSTRFVISSAYDGRILRIHKKSELPCYQFIVSNHNRPFLAASVPWIFFILSNTKVMLLPTPFFHWDFNFGSRLVCGLEKDSVMAGETYSILDAELVSIVKV